MTELLSAIWLPRCATTGAAAFWRCGRCPGPATRESAMRPARGQQDRRTGRFELRTTLAGLAMAGTRRGLAGSARLRLGSTTRAGSFSAIVRFAEFSGTGPDSFESPRVVGALVLPACTALGRNAVLWLGWSLTKDQVRALLVMHSPQGGWRNGHHRRRSRSRRRGIRRNPQPDSEGIETVADCRP